MITTEDKYTMGPELIEKLKKIGIDYPASSCPIAWNPNGWNWDLPDFLLYEVPNELTAMEWHLANLESMNDACISKWSDSWPEDSSYRFCHVRSQVFIDEKHDTQKRYVVCQPYIP